jgi:hypothetical protein
MIKIVINVSKMQINALNVKRIIFLIKTAFVFSSRIVKFKNLAIVVNAKLVKMVST